MNSEIDHISDPLSLSIMRATPVLAALVTLILEIESHLVKTNGARMGVWGLASIEGDD